MKTKRLSTTIPAIIFVVSVLMMPERFQIPVSILFGAQLICLAIHLKE